MADKIASVVMGETLSLQIKPTFEGVAVLAAKITLNEGESDLKGLVDVNAFTDGAEGIVNVPVVGKAVGVQDITVVFDYADAELGVGTEGWGKSTKTIAMTVTAAEALARLSEISTPLTMDLWQSKPFTFKVVKGEGEAENDITPSITGVSVNPDEIMNKFEFINNGDGEYAFKSIAASDSEVTTATAKLLVVGEHNSVQYTLRADVVLNTNINDGSIPANRFDVQFQ